MLLLSSAETIAASGGFCCLLRQWINVTGDRPKESGNLSRNCDHDDRIAFTLRHEPSIPCAQASLRFPGDVTHLLRQTSLPLLMLHTEAGRMAVSPCSLNQHFPRTDITGLGDPTLALGVAGRVFGWYKAQEAHQLSRMLKATEIAGFGHQRRRRQELNTAHPWKAETTGAIVQAGTIPINAASNRSMRSAVARIAFSIS